jgi:hypothetical protein
MVSPEIVSVLATLKIGNVALPLTVSADEPGPAMLMLLVIFRVPDVSWIVDGFGSAKIIVSPFWAAAKSARSVPGPLSAVLVTVNTLGSQRSSSGSM